MIVMSNTYDIFSGKDLELAELIQQRRLQVLVHSCIYYKLNANIVSDKQFDMWSRELAALQRKYPDIASKVRYADAFEGFDGSTGFDLPIDDDWVISKAKQLLGSLGNSNQPIVVENKSETKRSKIGKKRRLF